MEALKKIIVVGAGHMGSAIALGLRRANPESSILAIEPDAVRRASIINGGITAIEILPNPIASEVLFLATTPQDFSNFLEINPHIKKYKGIIISVMAGTCISELTDRLNCSQVFRAMPNLACAENEGVTIVLAAASVTQSNSKKVKNLLSGLGLLLFIQNEKLIHSATALVGGGPAYFSFFAAALYEYAISSGFEKASALLITAQLMSGTSRLLKLAQDDPIKLCERVMTPGGTTQQAVNIFEKNQIKKTIIDGLKTACARSVTLGRST
ncbi:pyrroline-5-carboxylate reductase family protein [Pseudomonas rhodesiae]|uniref:pyrroline-5-carboxylate reductase family protein n=1 Tax=Pseudomonas rhodesiae TaxID=76760 RepID=UPI002732A1FB|nr:pyrroline-5-carboxylate reductase dimerization domain-containing protein [Pseudomonas rhodesiae]WLG37258.1 pyrroline-5-carboxylate reductase dimerization domain-containing protein [Pseudomonas rhodesiae]